MSTTSDSSPVLVVGGGIAGLSTALALSRKGIPVQVIEQAAEFKEIGAGIQLGPNVFRMFEVLGLSEAVFRWAAFPEALEMRGPQKAAPCSPICVPPMMRCRKP